MSFARIANVSKMIAKTLVIVVALSGCSLGMRGPTSRTEPDGCSLHARPLADSMVAAGFALGGLLWIAKGPPDDEPLGDTGGLPRDTTSIGTRASLTLLPAGLFAAVATYGWVMAARCTCAHRHEPQTPMVSR